MAAQPGSHRKARLPTACAISFFRCATTGWAVGRAGTILHTADGGATWEKQDTGDHEPSVCRVICRCAPWLGSGRFGHHPATADGGATWKKQGAGEDKIYNDVFFADAQHGWVVGEYGTILATADGGATWQKQECKDIIPVVSESEWESFAPSLYGVHFSDASKRACLRHGRHHHRNGRRRRNLEKGQKPRRGKQGDPV